MTIVQRLRITLYVATICSMVATFSFAQPEWSVNPSEFEFTMTVTAGGTIHCVEVDDENDIVAAFIDGEIRGVQSFDVTEDGRQLAFLIVYDNTLAGNAVTFKLYDASADVVVDAVQTVEFLENGDYGSAIEPYELSTSYVLESVAADTDSVGRSATPGTVVTDLYAIDTAGNAVPVDVMFGSDVQGPDNDYFSITGNSLILEDASDLGMRDLFVIHVTTVAGDTCSSAEGIIEIRVVDTVISHLRENVPISTAIQLYPNPARYWCVIESERYISAIYIFDVYGRQLYHYKDVGQRKVLDISGLQSGNYVCLVRQGNTMTARPLHVFRSP